jgi:hypothetical protein
MVGNMVGVGGPTIRSGCLPISGWHRACRYPDHRWFLFPRFPESGLSRVFIDETSNDRIIRVSIDEAPGIRIIHQSHIIPKDITSQISAPKKLGMRYALCVSNQL